MRQILIGIAVLYLAVAAVLLLVGLFSWFIIWSAFEVCVLLAALLFERWHYRPQVNRRIGNWQATGERFVDPATGRLMQVFYNPDTGERDYGEVGHNSR